MIGRKKPQSAARSESDELSDAVMAHMAVVWFAPDGEVLDANDVFCRLMGYEKAEIVGQNHKMLVGSDTTHSPEYRKFWDRLRNGEEISERVPRIAKDEHLVWLQASYVPMTSGSGAVTRIVTFATDVTEAVRNAAREKSKLAAISRSQAIIEFDLEGHVLDANENFLAATGYTLDEIRGKHHAIFVPDDIASKPSYREFWATLARGEPKAGAFRRKRKQGAEIWLQATYNPIIGARGVPVGVIKFAHDITQIKNRAIDHAGQIEALGRPGDIAIGLSTSGKSPNVLRGLEAAKAQGLTAVAMVGANREQVAPIADIVISVPARAANRIQEMHILIGHALCGSLERRLGLVEEQ